jgi:hypothetical protein
MKKIVLFLIFLFPFISTAQWSQLGSEIDGQLVNEQSGTSTSLNADGTVLVISSPRAVDNGISKGKVSVYDWNGSNWIQRGAAILGSNQGDIFGEDVSINADGTILAVGAPGYNSPTYLSPTGPTGYTRVFEWNGTTWLQKGTDILGEAPNDVAGSSLSLSASGTIIAIGASSNNGVNGSSSGHCRIYEWNGTAWVQKGADIDGEAANDYSGTVSLNAAGTIVAIGAGANDAGGTNTGQVRVYEWNGTSWIQKGADVDSDNTNASFGSTLSLDAAGTTFIAGGYSFVNGALGFVKIYTWNGSNWVQKGQTILGDNPSDFLGTDVDINEDGSIIAVGSVTGNANGYARVLKFIGNSWVPQGSDVLGETLNDQFGRSVSLSANGSILAAGTPYNDGNGNNAGHVRVFENSTLSTSSFTRNTISIYPNPSSDYIEVTGLTSPDTYIIYSVLGTKISSGTISSNQKIDIQNYSTGVYFLKLENEEVLKFIKN